MVKIPVRNKSKDNPYTLDYNELTNTYTVEFKDNKNERHIVEISEKVYQAFNKFELEDVSQMHKYRKHIEHSEVYDETLYHKSFKSTVPVDEQVIMKSTFEDLYKAINLLPEIQKRRIKKYYFDGKNGYEIADEEGTTQQSVHIGLDRARKKLAEILKNYQN